MNHATYLYKAGKLTAEDWQKIWQKLEMRIANIDIEARKERHFSGAVVKVGPKFKAFFSNLRESNPDQLIKWSDMCGHTDGHAVLDIELGREWTVFVFDPASRTQAEVQMENSICFAERSQQR